MTPIPTDESVGTSSQVQTVGSKPSISMAVAEKAARDAGFNIIDAKQLKAAGIFGEFVSQVGAIHLGRSRLAMNLARTDKAMDFCEKAIEHGAFDDADAMVGVMKVHASLIGESNKAAELLIKSAQQAAETAKAEASVQLPGFAPRAQVGLTQVNVSVNAKGADTSVTANEEDNHAAD
jgi:hypothetical protein